MAINIYQIFYDQQTRDSLDEGFLPLDNSLSERPDWFEFWPIRKFLKETKLNDKSWYGFLSPKFVLKTGFTSKIIKDALNQNDSKAEVALFTSTWDFISYFKNCWEQGEVWHEHITVVAQQFFNSINYPVDCANMINYSKNSVTSNYVIAKPRYWKRWLQFADVLLEISETDTPFGKILRGDTTYGPKAIPWKVFIQERLASVILHNEPYNVLAPDQSTYRPLFSHIFYDDGGVTRRALQTCDFLKERYFLTKDEDYLKAYFKIKASIPHKPFSQFR